MYEVTVLFDGYSEQLDPTAMTADCTCTLIKGPNDLLVIVDTMTAWDRDVLLQALAQRNVDPQDVNFVICTHSHADHIGNNNLFTSAEHIIGHCIHRGKIFIDKNLKNEDYVISPGIIVTATPGHTAEDVTVLVNTMKDGQQICYAITGDLFEKEEDILRPLIWKSMGMTELRRSQAIMRSRIINVADFIIPGHGPMFRVTDEMREIVHSQARLINNDLEEIPIL